MTFDQIKIFIYNKCIWIIIICIGLTFLFFRKKIYLWILEKIKSNSRILIVDDQSFPYIDELKKIGYRCKFINDLNSTILDHIRKGNYKIILLDIHGVGKGIGCDDGISVLESIKKLNHAQKVIMFSVQKYEFKSYEKIKMADSIIPKSASLQEYITHIDDLLFPGRSIMKYIFIVIKIVFRHGQNISC